MISTSCLKVKSTLLKRSWVIIRIYSARRWASFTFSPKPLKGCRSSQFLSPHLHEQWHRTVGIIWHKRRVISSSNLNFLSNTTATFFTFIIWPPWLTLQRLLVRVLFLTSCTYYLAYFYLRPSSVCTSVGTTRGQVIILFSLLAFSYGKTRLGEVKKRIFFSLRSTSTSQSTLLVELFILNWACRHAFCRSCWPTRDHIGRSTRNSNPVMTSSGPKGWSDHRCRAPLTYTAQLLTLHLHRANNQDG